jgi:hypothetical protein
MRLRSSNCAIRSPPQITLSPLGLPRQRCSATSASALTNPRAWCIAKARRCVALAVGRAGGAQFLLQLVDQYDGHVRHDRHALPVDVLSFVYDPTAPTPSTARARAPCSNNGSRVVTWRTCYRFGALERCRDRWLCNAVNAGTVALPSAQDRAIINTLLCLTSCAAHSRTRGRHQLMCGATDWHSWHCRRNWQLVLFVCLFACSWWYGLAAGAFRRTPFTHGYSIRVRTCSSCITAFIFDNILRPEHKFSMVTIQTATLSGGVRPALTRPCPA